MPPPSHVREYPVVECVLEFVELTRLGVPLEVHAADPSELPSIAGRPVPEHGAFDARVRAGFERVLTRTDGDLLVVAHRGVIRRIADLVLPGQGEHATELASLSTLELSPARVVRWNVVG